MGWGVESLLKEIFNDLRSGSLKRSALCILSVTVGGLLVNYFVFQQEISLTLIVGVLMLPLFFIFLAAFIDKPLN